MVARARRFFATCVNDLEARLSSAHIWQYIVFQGTRGGLALAGEVPEAETWAKYAMNCGSPAPGNARPKLWEQYRGSYPDVLR